MATVVPVLECEAIVRRLMRKKAWVDQDTLDADTKAILPDAYLRRREVDTDGLSAGIRGACTLEDFKASLNKVHGIVSLHVGRVRDLGLDVVPDDPHLVAEQGRKYDPCHANIVNIPYDEDDPKEAERLAGLLARQSRWIPT